MPSDGLRHGDWTASLLFPLRAISSGSANDCVGSRESSVPLILGPTALIPRAPPGYTHDVHPLARLYSALRVPARTRRQTYVRVNDCIYFIGFVS